MKPDEPAAKATVPGEGKVPAEPLPVSIQSAPLVLTPSVRERMRSGPPGPRRMEGACAVKKELRRAVIDKNPAKPGQNRPNPARPGRLASHEGWLACPFILPETGNCGSRTRRPRLFSQ